MGQRGGVGRYPATGLGWAGSGDFRSAAPRSRAASAMRSAGPPEDQLIFPRESDRSAPLGVIGVVECRTFLDLLGLWSKIAVSSDGTVISAVDSGYLCEVRSSFAQVIQVEWFFQWISTPGREAVARFGILGNLRGMPPSLSHTWHRLNLLSLFQKFSSVWGDWFVKVQPCNFHFWRNTFTVKWA